MTETIIVVLTVVVLLIIAGLTAALLYLRKRNAILTNSLGSSLRKRRELEDEMYSLMGGRGHIRTSVEELDDSMLAAAAGGNGPGSRGTLEDADKDNPINHIN